MRILAIFIALGVAPSTSLFAGVIYDFSGVVNMFGTKQLFRYTAPDFITADTFVPAGALDMCTSEGPSPCFGVNFLQSGPDTPEHYPEITFQSLNLDGSVGTVFYYFPLDVSFAEFGTLSTVPELGNTGTLTIAPIPEPATWLLMSGGVIFAAFSHLLRRRPSPVQNHKDPSESWTIGAFRGNQAPAGGSIMRRREYATRPACPRA